MPEQYTSNANRYGPRIDIYAFGCTLYRAISGSRPMEATSRQLKDEVLPVAQVAKTRYRDNFLKAIDWSMKLPPDERPKSIGEWRRTLLESGPQRSSAARMTRVMTGVTTLVPSRESRDEPQQQEGSSGAGSTPSPPSWRCSLRARLPPSASCRTPGPRLRAWPSPAATSQTSAHPGIAAAVRAGA
jgi:serine/threonine protein kinase